MALIHTNGSSQLSTSESIVKVKKKLKTHCNKTSLSCFLSLCEWVCELNHSHLNLIPLWPHDSITYLNHPFSSLTNPFP